MKRNSWLMRYFVSYLAIGVLPVLILGSIFYYGSQISVHKEIDTSNHAALIQTLNKLDYVVEKMSSIAYHFSGYEFDDTVIWEQAPNNFAVNEGLIVSQLKTYNESVDNIPIQTFLYVRGDNYVYTYNEKMPYSEFEDSLKDYGDLTMSSFYTEINSLKYKKSMKLYQNDAITDKSKAMTVYLYPIPYMNLLPTATLGFMFHYDDLHNMIENYLGEMNANIYIYNEYYQNIYTNECENVPENLKLIAKEQKGIGVFHKTIDGEPYVVMRSVSQNSGFSIVITTGQKEFYGRMKNFEYLIAGAVILLILMAILLAIVLSKRYYNPIKQLLYQTSDKALIGSNKNEFEIIQSHWTDIKSENQELSNLVSRQRPMVVASCLGKLLNGKFTSLEEIDFSLKSANINLSYPYLFVMLLPLPISENSEMDCSKDILSSLRDAARPFGRIYGIDLIWENSIAAIVNCTEKEINGEDIRIHVAKLIQKDIIEAHQIVQAVSVGRIYQDISDVNTSFIEATVVLSDCIPGKLVNIMLFEQIVQSASENQYPVVEQAVYIQCLKQANKEAALKALEEMVAVVAGVQSFLIIQCLCYDIINMIIKTVNNFNGFSMKMVDLKEICTFSNIEEFRQKSRRLTEIVCDQYEQFQESNNNHLRSDILNYVNINYAEFSMGLDDVAGHFGLTSNYLSRFFKQETGCNFIQYVTMLRMDRAKELLMTTDMQVKDIVAKVGYIDVANFVRKFKSHEGLTPGQYREQMRKK